MIEERNINQLPKDWKWVKLSEIVSVLGDGLHGTPEYSESGEYFFINGNNLSKEKIIIKENTKRVSAHEHEKYKKQLTDNTILVSINGTIGNVAFYNNEKVVLGKSACYFNIIDDVDKHYIALLLQGRRFLRYANNSATGSTIKNVSLKAMREFELPLPPKETQSQIVSKIEELFSEIDKGIEEIKTAQQQLKVYRQAVLKWAFEGKLTNENAKEGELPKEWKWVKLNDVCVKIQDGNYGEAYPKKEEFLENGIPFLTSAAIGADGTIIREEVKYISPQKHSELRKAQTTLGDVLFTNRGARVGETAIITDPYFTDSNIGPQVTRICADTKKALPKFIFYWLRTTSFKAVMKKGNTGSAMDFINLTITKSFPLVITSIEEQQQIVQEIESRLSVCDKIEETITNSLKQAEALRQSILKKAFEGKLV